MIRSFRRTVPGTRFWALLLLGIATSPGLSAQDPSFFTSSGREMSRNDLETFLQNLDAAAADASYADALRERARAQAEVIRRRLAEGDFRVGDRIQVQVEGENWDASSPGAVPADFAATAPSPGGGGVPTGRGSTGATFAIQSGPSVQLPGLPVIDLRGVLRSELEEHLTEAIGTYIRDPKVTARALIRVSVFGSVGSPGFFYPAADQLVGDVIMLAGGPASTADMEDVKVRRGADLLWEGDDLQSVIAEGRTLDQLNFQAGDIIEVPERSSSGIWGQVARYTLIIGSSLLIGVRVF